MSPYRTGVATEGHPYKQLLANDCIHELIDRLTVFGNAFLHTSLKLVSRLFEHSRRGAVPIEHMSIYATQIVVCKCVVRHCNHRLRSNPASPELFAEPVSDLRGAPGHIRLQDEAYTTYRLTRYGNGEIGFRFVTHDTLEPVARVAVGVWIRKTIAQIYPDVAVVCMTHDGIAITPRPTAHTARC